MDITKLPNDELVNYNNARELKMQSMARVAGYVDEMLPDAISILDDICRIMEYEIEDQDLMRCHMKAAIAMLKQITN